MASRKRRSEEELNRNSVEVLEPVPRRTIMGTITNAISQAWAWCKDWYPGGQRPTTYSQSTHAPTGYTDMSYASVDHIADTHIQSSRRRTNGATTLKRQRLSKSKPSTSRPKSYGYRNTGGLLDLTGCMTEEDRKQRTNDYFTPPDLFMTNSGRGAPEVDSSHYSESPPSSRASDTPGSKSSSSPGLVTPEFMTSVPIELKPVISKLSQSPNYLSQGAFGMAPKPTWSPNHLSQSAYGARAKTDESTIEEKLKTVLIHDEPEPEILRLSTQVSEKRLNSLRERKAREREAAIRAAKELRLTRRDPLKPLVLPLSSKWESAVSKAHRTIDPEDVITTSIGGTELRLKDFRTLLDRKAWLNDEIINSYIEWIVDAANKGAATAPSTSDGLGSGVPKFIAHNSFFYQSLIKKGPESTKRLMMRKKAPGKALMEVDSVFVPICKGSHWTVGVVRPIAKTIEYFDSMGGNDRPFVRLMRDWLKFQLEDSYIEAEWTTPQISCAHQSNGYDCGVFVCTNAFCVALGLRTSCYRESDMLQQRRNIAAVLLNRGFTNDFDVMRGGVL